MSQEQDPIKQLLYIMAQLRDPVTGCPWDLEQSFTSITPYTLEEAYEVIDAIENNHYENLCSELGDLLFQIVFYAQLAKEKNMFDFQDVVMGVTEKMMRRHPHVFTCPTDVSDMTPDLVNRQWEEIKDTERPQTSILEDIPSVFPALIRAVKIQKRAARVGFDWARIEDIFTKLDEEVAELKQAISTYQAVESGNKAHREHVLEELGDVLFVHANIARQLNICPETALRMTNRKFITRFQKIEGWLRQQNKSIMECTLKEMEDLWCRAKQDEKTAGENK